MQEHRLHMQGGWSSLCDAQLIQYLGQGNTGPTFHLHRHHEKLKDKVDTKLGIQHLVMGSMETGPDFDRLGPCNLVEGCL